MKKVLPICFLMSISFVFLFNAQNANACTVPVIQYTAGVACTSQASLTYWNSMSMLDMRSGGSGGNYAADISACQAQINQYQADTEAFNSCLNNLVHPTTTTQPSYPATYTTNPPRVLDINPSGGIIPGFTQICMKGENFGTAAQSWTTKSSITIGGIDVAKAKWTDTLICFTAPDGLPLGGKMVNIT